MTMHHPVQENVITDVRQNMPMKEAKHEEQCHALALETKNFISVTWNEVSGSAKVENSMTICKQSLPTGSLKNMSFLIGLPLLFLITRSLCVKMLCN